MRTGSLHYNGVLVKNLLAVTVAVYSLSAFCFTAVNISCTSLINYYISGIVPIAEAKTVCAGSEKFYKMCDSNEVKQKEILLYDFTVRFYDFTVYDMITVRF